jgi:putative Ca2+/H+ antiporter (TMEM165/GDT1 family)
MRRAMDWETLLSTFGLVFVAELGDKTQLAVLTQTCKYRCPWAVFLGASLALMAVTALGVAGGQVMGRLVPSSVLRWGAALAFVVMGILVVQEAIRDGAEGPQGACPDSEGEVPSAASTPAQDWRAFGSTFGLLFIAEMGDKTQLAVLGLAGESGAPWMVFLGGGLALVVVTALGVVGGQELCRLIPRRVLLWVSAAVFVVLGILMGFGVL